MRLPCHCLSHTIESSSFWSLISFVFPMFAFSSTFFSWSWRFCRLSSRDSSIWLPSSQPSQSSLPLRQAVVQFSLSVTELVNKVPRNVRTNSLRLLLPPRRLCRNSVLLSWFWARWSLIQTFRWEAFLESIAALRWLKRRLARLPKLNSPSLILLPGSRSWSRRLPCCFRPLLPLFVLFHCPAKLSLFLFDFQYNWVNSKRGKLTVFNSSSKPISCSFSCRISPSCSRSSFNVWVIVNPLHVVHTAHLPSRLEAAVL